MARETGKLGFVPMQGKGGVYTTAPTETPRLRDDPSRDLSSDDAARIARERAAVTP